MQPSVKILAVSNCKGGVGKSSVSVNLADGLARMGERVLLVDLDPQGSASWTLTGVASHEQGTAEVLMREEIFEGCCVPVPDRPRLVLMPATPGLLKTDALLSAEMGGELVMGRVLRGPAFGFDYVLIDCPPGLSVSVIGALCAADGVLTPVVPAVLALAGLNTMEAVLRRIRKTLESKVQLLGAVIVAADEREGITEEVREVLRKESAGKVFASEIRVNARAKAMAMRTAFDSGDPRGKEDYEALLAEVLERLNKGKR